VYCATSGRSAMAAAVLQMMGFRNVLSIEGGYARWVADGMPQEHEASY
jgi:rhodanese-related sulfurtransferase